MLLLYAPIYRRVHVRSPLLATHHPHASPSSVVGVRLPTPGRSIVGAVGLGVAAGTDPAADFQPFRELCTVTAWSKNGGRRRQLYGGGECYSEWEYSFCVDTGSGTAECGYKSRTERTSCDKTTPTFVLGQGTTCWRPAPGFNPIGTSYRCGNKPLCYKIFDPADDVGTAAENSGAAFGVGLALLLAGETPLFRTWDPPTDQLIPCVASRSCHRLFYYSSILPGVLWAEPGSTIATTRATRATARDGACGRRYSSGGLPAGRWRSNDGAAAGGCPAGRQRPTGGAEYVRAGAAGHAGWHAVAGADTGRRGAGADSAGFAARDVVPNTGAGGCRLHPFGQL